MRRAAISVTVCVVLMVGVTAGSSAARPRGPVRANPIRHVVILYQENHSFNDLLGQLCISEGDRCDGTDHGEISNGTEIPLTNEPDIAPPAGHLPDDQIAAINGGKMNGWDRVRQCGVEQQYGCMTQVHAGAVPTLWSLADTYAISDRTFQTSISASWGSHLELAAATMDWFTGKEPTQGGGCETRFDTWWQGPGYANPIKVPACIPDLQGRGPYRRSPVAYVPTIMDSLDAAGLSWHIYAPGKHGGGGYGWGICPTFYECRGSNQHEQVRQSGDFSRDARAGKLPAVSIVIPYASTSQHNGHSLMVGDDWIARNVSAVMKGGDWASTAIFLTYDDCGCYYDPVLPPAGQGIRVPMVIISPYARPHFVDHTDATLASLLTFIEHAFGLSPLPGGLEDGAYDFSGAFNFAGPALAPIPLPQHRVPQSSLDYIASHPPDPDDPT